MSETEIQIFRAVFRYFAAHPSPPPITDLEASTAWWLSAAKDIGELSASWGNQSLIMKLLSAVYEYLEEKAKEATRNAQSL